MRPFPADLMRMWAISTRVNKPENDDPSIVEPIQVATDAAWLANIETQRSAAAAKCVKAGRSGWGRPEKRRAPRNSE